MSQDTIPTAVSQPLVAFSLTPIELAEIRGFVEHSIQMDGIGKDATGIELAKLAEKFTPAFLRKRNARFAADAKARGKDTWTEDPQEQSARLKLAAGILRKLAAEDVSFDVDVDTKLLRKARKLAKAQGMSLNQFFVRGLLRILRAEQAAKAA